MKGREREEWREEGRGRGLGCRGSVTMILYFFLPSLSIRSWSFLLFQFYAECPLSLLPTLTLSLSPPVPPSSLSLSPIPGSCHSNGVVSVVAAIVAVCAKAKIHPITPLLSFVNREESRREKERIFEL